MTGPSVTGPSATCPQCRHVAVPTTRKVSGTETVTDWTCTNPDGGHWHLPSGWKPRRAAS